MQNEFPGYRRCRFISPVVAVWLLLATSQARAQDLPAPTQNAIAGAAVFGDKGCVRCHSVSGTGQSLGPDLKRVADARSFQDLTATLWNHLPEMGRRMKELGIDRVRLSEREAGDLFAYLFTLGYFASAGDRSAGAVVFEEARCILCHQVRGVGGVVGPVLDHMAERGSPIEIAAAMWNHEPAMMAEAEARGISRPVLTGGQIIDLMAYFGGEGDAIPASNLYVLPGSPESGRSVLTDRYCLDCHGEPGAGGGIAPDLAALGGRVSLIDFVARMWNKAPAMRSALEARDLDFPKLEPGEFADIVAYLYSVNYFADAGSPSRGRSLLNAKGCARCHDTAGLSTQPGLDHPAALTAALWNHHGWPQQAEGADSDWPEFTGSEMGDLMAFFQATSP